MSGLPASWVDVAIGKVADIIAGGTPKANDPMNFAVNHTGFRGGLNS